MKESLKRGWAHAPSSWRELQKAVGRFLFAPASARPLAVLRITICATLFIQAVTMVGDVMTLYGSQGIIQGPLREFLERFSMPSLSDIGAVLGGFGVPEQVWVKGTFFTYMASLAFLGVGLFSRTSAAVAWLSHSLLKTTGYLSIYGLDNFITIFLFYFMVMPVGAALSLDRLWGRLSGAASGWNRLALRVLQLHLCISYFTTGIGKALSPQWWDGEAIWRALMLPMYRRFDFAWLADWPSLLILISWSTIVIELGYVVFIWPQRTRKMWLAATVAMHIGIAVFMKLNFFGIFMAFLTLCVWGFSAEPARAAAERSWGLQPRVRVARS